MRYLPEPEETLSNPVAEKTVGTVIISNTKNGLKVQSSLENIHKITIYDVLGRTSFCQDNINRNQFEVLNVVYDSQTLIVKVQLNNNTIVTKKVLF